VEPSAPYYALYSYKIMSSDRFDLLGNSMAILTELLRLSGHKIWWHGLKPSARRCGAVENWP